MRSVPKSRSQRVLAVAASLWFAFTAAAQSPQLHYVIDATGVSLDANELPLEVTLRVDAPPGASTVFEVPVWTPGSYRLRDFPERVTPIAARAGDRAVPFARLSPRSWEVVHGAAAASVELKYRVIVRTGDRFLHASKQRRSLTYEGPAVYLFVERLLRAPCTVQFALPKDWSVASGLAPAADGTFAAPDYDVLADCMVKLGKFQTFTWPSLGTTFHAVLDDEQDLQIDAQPWLDGVRAITEEGAMVFGGRYPYEHYWFLFTVGRVGEGGGLEHLNSTGIGLGRAGFVANPKTSFGIVAHEFFHCWNVKRLRPIELGPFRYDRPVRTTGLWLSEGVDSYYADVLQARAGHTTAEQFWLSMGRDITTLESTPGRHFTSSEQASLRVWDRVPPDRRVDYYNSGTVLGLLLDLQIRAASGNQKSLDDAMLAMLQHCEREHRGLTEAEIEAACSAAAGADLGSFFAACVRGTAVPDYAAILGKAGIAVTAEERTTQVLRGLELGRKEAPTFTDLRALETSGGGDPIGISGRVRKLGDQAVENAEQASAAVAAAVAAGKTSLAVDFERANGSIATVQAPIEARQRPRYQLKLQADAPPAALAIRNGITQRRRPQ